MIKDTLISYRNERKAFISSLKLHYGIDFYKLDVEERKQWFAAYLSNKREFIKDMIESIRYNSNKEKCEEETIIKLSISELKDQFEKFYDKKIHAKS